VVTDGIDYDHVEFEGRAFDGGYTRFNLRSGQAENCFHPNYGTHVASLAVGKSVGVAPKAKVYRYVCMCVCMYAFM